MLPLGPRLWVTHLGPPMPARQHGPRPGCTSARGPQAPVSPVPPPSRGAAWLAPGPPHLLLSLPVQPPPTPNSRGLTPSPPPSAGTLSCPPSRSPCSTRAGISLCLGLFPWPLQVVAGMERAFTFTFARGVNSLGCKDHLTTLSGGTRHLDRTPGSAGRGPGPSANARCSQ